jgi:hypothetical protein
MRTVLGMAAGIGVGTACAWFFHDRQVGVFAGALVGITIRFWAWGPVLGGRRG